MLSLTCCSTSCCRWSQPQGGGPASPLSILYIYILNQRAENGGLGPSWLDLAFLGPFNFPSRGPKTLENKHFGTSGLKMGVPQRRQIQPRRIQPPILGPPIENHPITQFIEDHPIPNQIGSSSTKVRVCMPRLCSSHAVLPPRVPCLREGHRGPNAGPRNQPGKTAEKGAEWARVKWWRNSRKNTRMKQSFLEGYPGIFAGISCGARKG